MNYLLNSYVISISLLFIIAFVVNLNDKNVTSQVVNKCSKTYMLFLQLQLFPHLRTFVYIFIFSFYQVDFYELIYVNVGNLVKTGQN